MVATVAVGADEVIVAVGIDTTSVAQAHAALDRFGDAYVRRVCSPAEEATLPPEPDARAHRLALLWAAKEAVTKTLAPAADDPWPWSDVSVDLDAGTASVRGTPGTLARRAGIDRFVVTAASIGAPVAPAPDAGNVHAPHAPSRRRSPATATVLCIALRLPDPRRRHDSRYLPHE